MDYPIPARGEITLDDDVLKAFRTYGNGCNFKLDIRGSNVRIDWGCYFLYRLAQGAEGRLLDWMESHGANEGPVPLPIKPETLVELLKRKPCTRCGGFRFYKMDNQ